MPIVINVGLSRKTSENYNSSGVSINLTAELDQSLLARPDELQGAVSELYEQAEQALDRQASGERPASNTLVTPTRAGMSNGNGHANGRGGNGRSSAPNGRGMTKSQRAAIHAIASQLGVDAVDEARHELGIDLERASISEASKLIDHLKQLQAPNTNGSRR